MEAIFNLFKSEATLRDERIAAWKADEPRWKIKLEHAMRVHGIGSKQANAIEKNMDLLEARAYALTA